MEALLLHRPRPLGVGALSIQVIAMSNNIITICLFTLLLFGCASTPPGQIKPSEVDWRTITTQSALQSTYKQLLEGFRYCGSYYGVPECRNYPDEQEINCDIYTAGTYGGRSDHVMGFIQLARLSDSETTLKTGYVGLKINEDSAHEYWQGLAVGDYSCK